MKALLLAAGYGTRLKPITDTIPKCLVPINGKPLLEIWLETLVDAGINEFIINTHYLHTQVQEFVQNSIYKEKIILIYEDNLLGTGGTILKNKTFFEDAQPFMVVHADNLSLCNYHHFILSHKNKPINTMMTMMTFTTDTPETCGIVELNNQNIVVNFYEKIKNPPSNLANGAVYIFDYEIIAILEAFNKENIDLSTEVLPLLLGKVNTYFNDNIHIDIGTPKAYEEAQKVVYD
jgi:mannose-1-phosphate guanylyltransferase